MGWVGQMSLDGRYHGDRSHLFRLPLTVVLLLQLCSFAPAPHTPHGSVVDVRTGTTEEQSNAAHYRFGPTRFSVIPKAAVRWPSGRGLGVLDLGCSGCSGAAGVKGRRQAVDVHFVQFACSCCANAGP